MGPLEAKLHSISVHICNFDLFTLLTLSSETVISLLDYIYRDYELPIKIQNKHPGAGIEF